MKTIKKSYKINASIDKVWEALTDPKKIEKWSGSNAKMRDEKGFKFSLWGGDIWGTNLDIIKNQLIHQEWFSENPDEPTDLRISLSEKNGVTFLDLVQKQVPENKYDDLSDGWDNYYINPLKELVEK